MDIFLLRRFLALAGCVSLLFFHTAFADDPVVAEIEGEKVRLSRLQKHAEVLGQELNDENYEMVLGQMVEARLIANKGKDLDLQDSDSFEILQRYSYEQQLIMAYLEYIKENMDSDDLEKAYKEWFADNPDYDEVDLQRISLDSREAAEEVIFMLDEGEPFDQLASRFSQDALASQGGRLGSITRRGLPASIAVAVFALEEGQHTDVPVFAGDQWFVFRVMSKGRAQIPSYEDVEEGLRSALAARKMKREAAALKLERSIKIYNMDGSPIS